MITLDSTKFDQALKEYSNASDKDFAEIVNRQVNNLAIKGLGLAKKAEASQIKGLQNLPWWPKLISKLLIRNKAVSLAKALENNQIISGYVERSSNEKGFKKAKRAVSKFLSGGKSFTHAQASRLSRKLISKRLRAISFIKFFFASLSKAVQPYTKGGKSKGVGKTFQGFDIYLKPATEKDNQCIFRVNYKYSKRRKSAQALLDKIFNQAISTTIADMRSYVEKKRADTARRYSAR